MISETEKSALCSKVGARGAREENAKNVEGGKVK
jgi:hypothetical protein